MDADLTERSTDVTVRIEGAFKNPTVKTEKVGDFVVSTMMEGYLVDRSIITDPFKIVAG